MYHQQEKPTTRAGHVACRLAAGFGFLGLAGLLSQSLVADTTIPANPMAPRPPTLPRPGGKRVIFLFMHGGPSSVDTFDPKVRLDTDDKRQALSHQSPTLFFEGSGMLT
jgi:hypothetical protein